jgi:integrase
VLSAISEKELEIRRILLAEVRRRLKRKERKEMPRQKKGSSDGLQVRGKNGLVSYVVNIKDPTRKSGYRQIRHSGFKTRKEAEAHKRQTIIQRDSGLTVSATNLTIAEFFPDALETHIRLKEVRPQTADNYRLELQTYILPKLGTIKMKDCSVVVLNKFLNEVVGVKHKANQPLSRAVMEKIVYLLKIGFKRAKVTGAIPFDPSAEISIPRASNKKVVKEIPPHLLESIRKEWWKERLAPFLETCLHTGARGGEIGALRWNDIDLQAKTIQINKTHYFKGARWYENEPKSRNGVRTISISDELVQILKEWRKSQAQDRLKAGALWQGKDYVFASEIGAPIAHPTYYNAWRRTLRRLDIKGFQVHSLRHTHISTLLRAGIALNIVARRVGDKPETILRTYAHCLPLDDLKCAQAFEEALGG